MIIVPPGRKGFYSIVLWYLSHCHMAEKYNDDVIIYQFSDYYYDKTNKYKYQKILSGRNAVSEGFLQFFENPFDIDKNLKYYKNFYDLVDIEQHQKFDDTIICGFILDKDLRKYIKFLIDKYLKIKKSILDKIDNYSKVFYNKKVLGVHIRQTDLYRSQFDDKPVKPVDFNIYIDKINENINNYDLLYLMSDNIISINKIEDYFKDKIEIFYIKDILRSNDDTGLPLIRNKNIKVDKYQLGEDILIETELLSMCNKILITNSNISSFVLANNPDIDFEYLDLGIKSSNNYIKHFYKDIHGWFNFDDIYLEMIHEAKDGYHFVEIGSWLGKSSSYMAVEIANSGKKIQFDVVDIWDFNNCSDNNYNDILKKNSESAFDMFIKNINPVKNYINIIRGYSKDISVNYEDNSLDFVFIDASHDYDSVKQDLQSWYPKIKIGCVMAGHDYISDYEQNVKRAVDEFFGDTVLVKNTSWFIRK